MEGLEGTGPGREVLAGPGETTWGCRDEEEVPTEPRGPPFRAWAEGGSRGGWKGVTAQREQPGLRQHAQRQEQL